MQKNSELNSINPVKIVIIFWVQKITIALCLYKTYHSRKACARIMILAQAFCEK